MKNHLLRLFAFTVFFSGLICLSSTSMAADLIRINGTGGAISTIRHLANTFHQQYPDVHFEIINPVMGSGGSIRALNAGALDIAISARAVKEKEKSKPLSEIVYARTPFVMAVANSNDQALDLTRAELADIYAGRRMQWPDGSRLRLILRPTTDSDTTLLRGMSAAMDRAVKQAHTRKGMAIGLTDQETADLIESVDGAIGSSLLSLIISEQRNLRPLALEGIMPSLETMQQGSYPYHKTFRLVYPSSPSVVIQQFIAFIHSPEACRILTENGNQALLC